MSRTFTHSLAKREAVPLLIGLAGPSGSGKTYSALRLATGMQRVTGGEIFVVDTEARRASHYAESFAFQHVVFEAPFSPLDYLAAIEHCVLAGAKIIIVDSMSHEHEGPGGVLEMHAAAVERMSGGDQKKAERVSMAGWVKPKQERRQLLNRMVQLGVSVICCFRAKEKIKVVRGKDPEPLGWMPIAGEEFIYEMTVAMGLPPRSQGTPDWNPTMPGEKAMTKLPVQFEWLHDERRALDEATGERMARWAAGVTAKDATLMAEIRAAETADALQALVPKLTAGDDKDTLRVAFRTRRTELTTPQPEPEDERRATAPRPDEWPADQTQRGVVT